VIRLLLLFVNLCRLKIGPQDLPTSNFLLGASAATYIVISTLLLSIEADLLLALAQSVVDLGLLAIFIWSMLALRGLQGRFTQTMTALAGSKVVLELASWPIAWYMINGGGEKDPFAGLMLLVLVFWILAVLVHIFRNALSMKVGAGVMISLSYLMLSFVVMTSLFPPPPLPVS